MKKSLSLFIVCLFLLSSLTSCTTTELSQKTKEGATVGAVAGGVLGVLFDKHNRWRGAVLGVALGALIGGTAGAIMEKASKESATYKKPVTYESEDKVQRVYAQPVKSEGKCEWIKVQYYEYGKLVKEETKKVCP
ncbi:MAG: glycine zipper 2TM domain-containing protein [Caldimicrobium sp.]|nr:glycine zipper 2TM domain-containing protein [Caldimicrobium sp.]MCX7613348.1 glycine zipper 2TM domain-containing protein [Caldimicrobium sp.]